MEKVTAVEFQNNFGEYSAKAARKPLAITKYGRPQLVVISIEDFMEILKHTQKSFHVSELGDDQLEAIRKAEAPKANEFLNDLLDD